jgi:hypothetical protein
MNIEARKAYRKAVQERYNKSSKKQKNQILNEFCEVCNYSRKHAIKVLNKADAPSNILSFKKPVGAQKKYSKATTKRLIQRWQLMNYPCSVNLKQPLALRLPYDLDTSEEIKSELYRMSESTIERYLKPTKSKRPKGKSTTTPSKFKSQMPLKLCKDDDKKSIGFFEMDTVAHCGEPLSGQFAWSLAMTDLHSGWTENRAIFSKESFAVKEAIRNVEENLPFKIIGVSSDNGTEFLNQTLQDYLLNGREVPLEVSRGRPYKKNDNAHVEQKNFTHVRNVFGYERIDEKELIKMMNSIYQEYLSPLKNFFTPCLKLKKKRKNRIKNKKEI